MLYIVLALVLAAFGLLIAALTTANTIWAWISVTISVVAAALLIADWVSARRRPEPAAAPAAKAKSSAKAPAKASVPTRAPLAPATSAAERSDTFEPVRAYESGSEPPAELATERTIQQAPVPPLVVEEPVEQPTEEPADKPTGKSAEKPTGEPATEVVEAPVRPVGQRTGQRPPPPPPDQEPEEEQTDAADLLVVSELTAEVRVVDERPRYHLSTCAWLRDKPTLPLPVNEARQLGFTPCSYCGPDAVLAARRRAAR